MDPDSRGLKILDILKRKTDQEVLTAVENNSALLCSPTGKLSEVIN